MTPEHQVQVDHRLHHTLVQLVSEHGDQPLSWLVRRARKLLGDARVDEDAVMETVECSTLLVPTVIGHVGWLGDALDGIVLTHRARAPLAGRRDLWGGVGLQPLLTLAAYQPLPLAGGGEVVRMETGHEVLVGPEGWLPDVPRFGLVALLWSDGKLSAEPVGDDLVPDPSELQSVRALIAGHYRRERWWGGEEELESRPGELVRALTLARMEDPDLLSTPMPPLDELLYNPLERQVDEHHWRNFAAARQEESVTFGIGNMPAALYNELSRRAQMYGMSLDQFVIALLGHLAWRTPFAEDCEPYESWAPEERSEPSPPIRLLSGGGEADG